MIYAITFFFYDKTLNCCVMFHLYVQNFLSLQDTTCKNNRIQCRGASGGPTASGINRLNHTGTWTGGLICHREGLRHRNHSSVEYSRAQRGVSAHTWCLTLQELGGAGLFNRSFQSSSDFWQLTRMIGEFKAGCGRLQRCCTLSFISQDVWIYSLSVSSRTRKPFSRYNTCTH